jgi:hypothetical protein
MTTLAAAIPTPVKSLKWEDVTAMPTGSTKNLPARAVASMRWWENGGPPAGHIKGDVVLQEKSSDDDVSFRIAFDGVSAINGKEMFGALMLPFDVAEWNIAIQKVKSKNAKARVVTMTFNANSTGLTKVQITIPFEGAGKTEKLLGEGLVYADQKRKSNQTPLASNPRKSS